MEKKVHESISIQSYETDLEGRLKPFFLQNHIQEVAYKGSALCGVSYDTLREHNLSWVLNRIHVQISELPLWGDEVLLDTWSRSKVGPLWHRNFRMFGQDGRTLMLATSAWTVLDLGSRSIFRGDLPFDSVMHVEEDTLPYCSRIAVPKDLAMESAGCHSPLFSEFDTNGHVNNCYYTEWAMDSLPFEYLSNHILKDLEVNYYREVHPGCTIDYKLGRQGDRWYFEGLLEGALCFVVALVFAPGAGRVLTA